MFLKHIAVWAAAFMLLASSESTAAAQAATQGGKGKIVQSIKVVGLISPADALRRGAIARPVVIKTNKEYHQALPSDAVRKQVAKQVDFRRHYLILFRWPGSGQDKLTPISKKINNKVQVVFHYQRGRTRDLRGHIKLFAIQRGVAWSIQGAGVRVPGSDKKPKKIPRVSALEIPGLERATRAKPGARATRPTVLSSAKEVAAAIPDKQMQVKILEQVDFQKQKLLYFRWTGSGGDRLTHRLDKTDKGEQVVFRYTLGFTDDIAQHARLFALREGLKWRVERK